MSTWLIGEALEDRESAHHLEGVAAGAMVGSATGAIATHFLDLANPRGPRATALVFTGTGLGWLYGEELGRTLIPPDAPGATERIRAAGLAGSMAGVGVGTAFGPRAGPVGHQLHVVLANGVGWTVGTGIGDLAGWDRVRQRQARAAVETGAALGLGGLALAANRADLGAPSPELVTLALADGAWYGAWAPWLFSDSPSADAVRGGLEVGAGVGYGAGLAMTALGPPTGKSLALQAVGLTAGSALGAGIPLSVGQSGHTRAVVAPMLATGLAGQVIGAAVAPRYQVDENDRLVLATLGTWTGYQAAGWAAFATETGVEGTQAVGYALTAGGAGTLASVALVPVLDLSPPGSVMLLSGGGWGTWFGAWGAQIAQADADGVWLAALAGGDGLMLGSAIAQGAGWEPTWRQTAMIDGYGLLGAAGGGLLGAIALYDPDDWRPVSASVVAGSGAGIIAGGVLSALPQRARAGSSASLTARLPFQARAQARPWIAEDGSQGLWLELDLTER